MAIVREIDINNDWTFGNGKSNYRKDIKAVSQNIKTRLQSYLGDCFFDVTAGIDWFNLLGSKQVQQLRLAIASVILNTENVTGILELSFNLDESRNMTLRYDVQTAFGNAENTLDLTVPI